VNPGKKNRPAAASTMHKETPIVTPLRRLTARIASSVSGKRRPDPVATPRAAKSPPRPSRWRRLGGRVALLTTLATAALLPIAGPAAAAEPPAWKLTVTPNADYFLTGSTDHSGVYKVEAENTGGQSTSGEIRLQNTAPPGTEAQYIRFYSSETGLAGVSGGETGDDLAEQLCPSVAECSFPGSLKPHHKLVLTVSVRVPAGLEGALSDVAEVSGGGAPTVKATAVNAAAASPPFGLLHFDAALTASSGQPYFQAGGHPFQFSTEFNFATFSSAPQSPSTQWDTVGTSPVRDPRAITADLPAGLLANPQAVPHCSLADWFAQTCDKKKDAVGDACLRLFANTEGGCRLISPIINLQPSGSYPGELGVVVAGTPFILITAGLRSGSDYGVAATNLAPETNLNRVRITLWGVPAAPEHNPMRAKDCGEAEHQFRSVEEGELECEREFEPGAGGPAETPEVPFLTMPTECSGIPLTIVGRYDTWQAPDEFAEADSRFSAVDGCNALSFAPTIEARPTTDLADSPSGFEFDLTIPQNEEPEGVATPSLKEAVVKLPPGLVVNPSSGAGLEGCSPAQVGLTTPVGQTPAHFTEEPAHCPDAAKLGNVEVKTPLLHEPLGSIEPLPGRVGSVYLATPHQNPSGSLLAGYIVLEGEGVIIKLAGQFATNPQTGQITASFLENPQAPFEEFKFHFFEGARGALRTPAVCGTYEVGSTLTPYSAPESGPPAEPTAEFETAVGPTGGACPSASSQEPNAPVFHAGTESPQAGIYSPFSLKLVRQDGEQEIKAIETTLPEGLTGKLAGTPYCPDAALAAAANKSGAAEQASPSCPAASEVGTVDVASGAGPTPLNVPGKAYLAGPYKGAPLSLAIITPAVAGPFDLGTVVVRTALYVNPETTQITAKSDPIPTILEGIPLDVRSITLKMARPNFTLNPTSCEPLAITGSALSVFGQSAPLSQRFQVGGCQALGFKPQLALKLKGATKRAENPALTATLTYPQKGNYANIASAQVTLPHSEFLDQAHIKTVCTRVQFAAGAGNGEQCPAASVYGQATAITPLLDQPVSGPVYLRSSTNKLPDLVAALSGQIDVDLDGKVDTGKGGGIRNSFEAVPDAPVSKFVLSMQGGKKGLLVNSENICSKPQRAIASFVGQNGKTYEANPLIANSCKSGKKAKKKGHGKQAKRAQRGTSHR
jgi:hypothetical protein